MQLDQIPILGQLDPPILVKLVKVLLQPLLAYPRALRRVTRVVVHVWQHDGLRELRLDVFARATVAVSARADFEVEGAVDAVLLCTAAMLAV